MAAAYDNYNYPAYWKGRDYEHKDEVLAIKSFLSSIPKINKILEIGAGFGRLTNSYEYRASKVILTDPSARLLKLARQKHSKNKKVKFIQSSLEKLPKKVKSSTVDLIIMVRVLHHLKDLDKAIHIAKKLLTKKGYLIIEFPNKKHLKAIIKEFGKGNLTFPLEIFPKDLTEEDPHTLPFKNYHPDLIRGKLESHGFKIVEARSVSNLRSSLLKRVLPLPVMLSVSKLLHKPLAKIDFGPSIFLLAQNKG